MGIPYSQQINAAFDQVTPLVAAGFDVLRTSRNISIFLLIIQILTALFLLLILIVLMALLVTVNPDLVTERQAVVTPAVKWIVAWLMDGKWLKWGLGTVIVGGGIGSAAGWWLTRDVTVKDVSEGGEGGEGGGEEAGDDEGSGEAEQGK